LAGPWLLAFRSSLPFPQSRCLSRFPATPQAPSSAPGMRGMYSIAGLLAQTLATPTSQCASKGCQRLTSPQSGPCLRHGGPLCALPQTLPASVVAHKTHYTTYGAHRVSVLPPPSPDAYPSRSFFHPSVGSRTNSARPGLASPQYHTPPWPVVPSQLPHALHLQLHTWPSQLYRAPGPPSLPAVILLDITRILIISSPL